MIYTRELFESRFLGLYWYNDAKIFSNTSWIFDYWDCGCIWVVLWKLRINILIKSHKNQPEIDE